MAYLLFVDDDEDFVLAAKMVLQAAGHEIHLAFDTQSGLESLERRKPDLLILDVMFPGDNTAGFKMANEIRANHKDLDDMPILVLTAVNEKVPLGFGPVGNNLNWPSIQDFIEKPVDLEVLTTRINAILEEAKRSG